MAAIHNGPPLRSVGTRTQVMASDSSRPTVTTTAAPPQQAVLHLRGAPREAEVEDEAEGSTRRRVQWAEGVVNNEGLGRKKSKICCIYHAPKGIDESSDESSSDSDDSDSGDDGSARPTGSGRKACDEPAHSHDHSHGKGKGKGRKPSPNAYERVPKPRRGGAKDKA